MKIILLALLVAFLFAHVSFAQSAHSVKGITIDSVSKAKSSSPSARIGLHDRKGHRLYLTAEERAAFLVAVQHCPREVRTLCVILHDMGCRISQALSLTADRVNFSGKAVVFETLKKRKRGVFRVVPLPDATFDLLAMVHGLRERKKRPQKTEPPLR